MTHYADLERELGERGDHPVDVPVTCVITRFGLRHSWAILPMLLDYRRVAAQANVMRPNSLLHSAFLVDSPTSVCNLSIWSNQDDIPKFGTLVPGHVLAARKGFGRLEHKPGRSHELWSTKWRLVAVSNNLEWDGFDLRRHILARQLI